MWVQDLPILLYLASECGRQGAERYYRDLTAGRAAGHLTVGCAMLTAEEPGSRFPTPIYCVAKSKVFLTLNLFYRTISDVTHRVYVLFGVIEN